MYRNDDLAIATHKESMLRIEHLKPHKKNFFLSKIRKYSHVIRSKVEP